MRVDDQRTKKGLSDQFGAVREVYKVTKSDDWQEEPAEDSDGYFYGPIYTVEVYAKPVRGTFCYNFIGEKGANVVQYEGRFATLKPPPSE